MNEEGSWPNVCLYHVLFYQPSHRPTGVTICGVVDCARNSSPSCTRNCSNKGFTVYQLAARPYCNFLPEDVPRYD